MRTYGYDYSYAITLDEVNRLLTANLDSANIEISYNFLDQDSGTLIKIGGWLGPWQLAPDGGNNLLKINVPILRGVMSFSGEFLKGTYDLSDVTLIMEISLGWMGPNTSQSTQGSGEITDLIFAPVSTTDPDNPGYVTTTGLLDPEQKLDEDAKGVLMKFMADVFVENSDKLVLIFNSINPSPANVASWLKPYKWQYFYEKTSVANVFCFLCQLTDKDFPAQPTFDSSALPTSTNSAILISQEIFFANAILPSIRSAISSGNFNLSTSNEVCTITNNGNFNVSTAKGEITANSFSLSTSNSGNGLTCHTSGGGPLDFSLAWASCPMRLIAGALPRLTRSRSLITSSVFRMTLIQPYSRIRRSTGTTGHCWL